MPVKHVNRRGQTYYLHRHSAKGGRVGYHFSLDEEGDLVDEIPAGYEIYENPNGQVFLRRQREKIIHDEEVNLVRDGVKRHTQLEYFLVDVRDNAIVVYTADQDVDGLMQIMGSGLFAGRERARERIEHLLSYSPMMRFVLHDREKRTFTPQRYCFRGSIDDWIDIGAAGPLGALVRRFIPHLDRESFFDLFYGF